jgi:hypothetical protein
MTIDNRRPRFCTQCGTALKPGARFCSGCGRPIAEPVPAARTPAVHTTPMAPSPTPTAPPKRRRGRWPLIAGGCALTLLCVVGIALAVTFWPDGGPARPGFGPAGGADLTAAEDVDVLLEDLATFHAEVESVDDPDWEAYPDRDAEAEEIEATVDAFTEALRQGDVAGAVAHVVPEHQEVYEELFRMSSEAMPAFADLIAGAEMTFLSEPGADQAFSRTAEVAVELDGMTFYVAFIKDGERWLLYDF